MSYTPPRERLRGLSTAYAGLYGMPCVGAYYERDDTDSNRLKHGAVCARCGAKAVNSHHEPPKSKGRSFLLATPMGQFVLKPALIALCGSGTTGCHGMRHSGLLRFRWEWDSDEIAEKWWDGWWLSHGYRPNSQSLFELGAYIAEENGKEWVIRR